MHGVLAADGHRDRLLVPRAVGHPQAEEEGREEREQEQGAGRTGYEQGICRSTECGI